MAHWFLIIIVKSIMRMVIFLAQVYSFLLFVYYCKKYHQNENVSSANLLHVLFFVYYCKKYHTNENISGENLLFVNFCLLL